MSDGGEESKRECEQNAFRRPHPDDYGRAVAKIAVAQICEEIGFESSKQSAMEALSDVVIQYICDLGKSASFYANLASRSDSNVFDLLKSLEDFGSISGFSGVNHGVIGSDIVKEMTEFVGKMEEIPFSQPIPGFPVTKSPKLIPSFSEMGEIPSSKHIPTWLPAFPDTHTYIQTPIWNERKTDPQADKIEQARQRRKAERSLLSLQQRLLSNGLAGPSMSEQDFHDGKKDVSVVVLPDKHANKEGDNKHVSVLETFAPAIDAMKGGSLSDSMDIDQRVVSERRPVVHFKMKAGKKMLIEDLDVNLRNRVNEKKGVWIGRDDEKDDKKRRAELILRQSVENTQEMSQV